MGGRPSRYRVALLPRRASSNGWAGIDSDHQRQTGWCSPEVTQRLKLWIRTMRMIWILLLCVPLVSCQTRRGFQHYSLVFEIPLHAAPRPIPESSVQIELLRIDNEQRMCDFRLTHQTSGSTAQEKVAVRDFYHSGQWFGT